MEEKSSGMTTVLADFRQQGGDGLMEMVDVPAGPLTDRLGKSSFKMGKYEVTQAQYEEVMGKEPTLRDSDSGLAGARSELDWLEAVKFCNALSRKEGKEEVYTITNESSGHLDLTTNFHKNGYRLPLPEDLKYVFGNGLGFRVACL